MNRYKAPAPLPNSSLRILCLLLSVRISARSQEAYLAIQLEQNYSKEQILEAYLNISYFGSGNYGVKTAAKDYFGKELKDLTIRECAILAGILKILIITIQERISMIKNRNPEITYNRTNLVLRLMYENGFITKEEYEEAKFSSDKDPFEDGFTLLRNPAGNPCIQCHILLNM